MKIKKFSKDYISKILRKMDKYGKRPKPPSFSTTIPTPSTSTHTPDSNDGGGDTSMFSMSAEEVMDMDPETDEENDEMVDGEGAAGLSDMPPPTHPPWTAHDTNTMDLEESFHLRLTTVPSDPRRRAPPDS
jgi:histone-lysine N-methyltransferase SETD2